MSCKLNGISMREGPAGFAVMPATVHHHGYVKDITPLTREQILSIPGVSMLPVRKINYKSVPKYERKESRKVYGRISDADMAGMVEQYKAKTPMEQIAENFGRDRSTVRQALQRLGVYRPVYASRIRGEHLSRGKLGKGGAA